MHCTSRALLTSAFSPAFQRLSTAPPAFLTPALSLSQTASFSSSPVSQARKRSEHDRNPERGVSALRRTGIRSRQKLSVNLANLPQPVLDPLKRSAVEVDHDHGLWEFFNRERTALYTPEQLDAYGRGWKPSELRNKDWDDLWRLWWTCIKEGNRLATTSEEMERMKDMSGDEELKSREKEVKKTMIAIKQILIERWYAWEDARVTAMDDAEVNLEADIDNGEPAYVRLAGPETGVNAPAVQPKSAAIGQSSEVPMPTSQPRANVQPTA